MYSAVLAQLGLGQHLACAAGGAGAFAGARAAGRGVATASGQHNTIHPATVFPHPHVQRVNAGGGNHYLFRAATEWLRLTGWRSIVPACPVWPRDPIWARGGTTEALVVLS